MHYILHWVLSFSATSSSEVT